MTSLNVGDFVSITSIFANHLRCGWVKRFTKKRVTVAFADNSFSPDHPKYVSYALKSLEKVDDKDMVVLELQETRQYKIDHDPKEVKEEDDRSLHDTRVENTDLRNKVFTLKLELDRLQSELRSCQQTKYELEALEGQLRDLHQGPGWRWRRTPGNAALVRSDD